MIKDLIMFTLKSLILAAIISAAIHVFITGYQVQIFDANSGIIKNYIEIVKEWKMINNEKEFLRQVKKDFPEFVDDLAILEDTKNQLMIKDSLQVEFKIFRNNKQVINLYNFKLLKSGNYRFLN